LAGLAILSVSSSTYSINESNLTSGLNVFGFYLANVVTGYHIKAGNDLSLRLSVANFSHFTLFNGKLKYSIVYPNFFLISWKDFA
jgi:hypothetical protein